MLSKQFAVSLERSMYKKKSLTKIAILTAVVAIGISITYAQDDEEDPIRELVSRLDLDLYKAVIKGLAQFGDRRQGTERNLSLIHI